MVDERSIKSEITNDTTLSYLVRMARTMDEPGFSPLSVRVQRDEKDSCGKLPGFYRADIEYSSADCALLFSKGALEKPLQHGNPALAAQQDAIVEHYIAELGLISEYMVRVKSAIHRLLSSDGVSVEQVAEGLNVTVRTLQRRLSAEQSSYNKLLDQVRRELAMDSGKKTVSLRTRRAATDRTRGLVRVPHLWWGSASVGSKAGVWSRRKSPCGGPRAGEIGGGVCGISRCSRMATTTIGPDRQAGPATFCPSPARCAPAQFSPARWCPCCTICRFQARSI